MRWRSRCLALTAAGFALVAASGSASAADDDVAAFFRNKTIEMVIGSGVGGGYDLYARLVARYIGKHIPGNPLVVPQNMPGAGSRIAANWLYNVAPKDGTAIGTIDQSSPLDQAMGEPGIQFDATQFNWLGNPIIDNLITIVSRAAGVKSLADLKAKGGLFCGDVGAGPTNTFPQIINRLLKTDNKIVTGYPGVNAIYLAMDSGEVNCIGGTTWSSMKATRGAQLRDHDYNIILQWGTQKDPDLSAYTGEDIPLSIELAQTDLDKKAVTFISASTTIGRPITAPPGVPKERVETLRHAFVETMKDPDFLAEAAKARMVIKPLAGDDLQALATELAHSPPDVVKRAEELTGLVESH
jgi:tripartite-type tricarboxylate transporter receptor subunit TctC